MSTPRAWMRDLTRMSTVVALTRLLGMLWLVWCCSPTLAGASEPPRWSTGPVPRWVAPIAEPADADFASAHPTQGLGYEILERQRRVVRNEDWTYSRVVVRVVSETGAEAAGQQSFEFSPPNERLILHSIRVHRDSQTTSHLDAERVQLLQREANLEQLVYDNRRTAFVLIPDLRVGDVLEYEWSIVGRNPVLGGHVMGGIASQREAAVGVLSSRLLVDRELHLRSFAGARMPVANRVGKLHEYVFREDSAAASESIDSLPFEEQVVPWVQLSDLPDWSSVTRWGESLFSPTKADERDVAEVLAELDLEDATPSVQAASVLRWVQSEIRYFSLPFAESTHRPTSPGLVLERRFGDCKDKALLMVVMLRALGLQAHVALVDTDGGRFLPELLPTIAAFDHAIVVADVEGQTVWLDPTSSYQRGSLSEMASRGLKWALPLFPGSDRLLAVEEPLRTDPGVSAAMAYRSASFDEPTELEMKLVYSGAWAEGARALWASSDEDGFAEAVEGKLRRLHADAEAQGPLRYHDDESRNSITVSRTYLLPSFWTESEGQLQAEVKPFILFDVADVAEPGREHPLALSHPLHYQQTVRLDLPEEFAASPEEARVDDGPVRFVYQASGHANVVELEWSFATVRHRVETHELEAYSAALQRIDDNFAFSLSSPIAGSAGSEAPFNWPVFMAASFWMVLLVAAAVIIAWKKPFIARPNVPYDPALAGLSGWLVLVGSGLVVSLLQLLRDLYEQLPSYFDEVWVQLTTVGSVHYDALWAPFLLFELLANLLLLVGSVLVLYMFATKSRSFPVVLITMHVVSPVVAFIDYGLTMSSLDLEAPPVAPLVGGAIRSVVWIAYALRSVRVRSTFLPPPPQAAEYEGATDFFPRRTETGASPPGPDYR